jgi:hypothetical protein
MSLARGTSLRVAHVLSCVAAVACGAGNADETADAVDWLREDGVVQVESVPSVVIGGTESEGSYNLYSVSGAVVLADGRIVIANAGEYELLVFDARGGFQGRFGSKGEGPGEYSSGLTPQPFQTDSALLVTAGVGRINRYSLPSLALQGAERLDTENTSARAALVGAFSDASLLVAAYPINTDASADTAVLRQPRLSLRRTQASRDSGVLVAVARETARYTHNSGPITSQPAVPVFGRDLFAVRDSLLVIAPTDSGLLRFVGRDGLSRRVLRWRVEQIPGKEAWAAYAADAARRVSDLPPPIQVHELSFFKRQIALPELAAAYRAIRIDASGRVWMGRVDWIGGGTNRWDVIDPELGTIRGAELPSRLQPLAILDTVLVGLDRDSLGVERIGLYRIQSRR